MLSSGLLRGTKVRLTAVTKADVPTLTRWWGSPEFLRLYDSAVAYPQNEEQVVKWLAETHESKQAYFFGIRPLADDILYGVLALDGIIWQHGTAGISIGIGERGNRGQGIGTEAMKLGLRFAFNELNLHRVLLTVFSYNKRAIAVYERLGFVHEGTHREHLLRDGKRYDMCLYGLLRHEWQAIQNEQKRA